MDKVNFTDKQEVVLADMQAIFTFTEQEFGRLVREYLSESGLVVAGFEVNAQTPADFSVKVKVDNDLGWALGIDPQTGKPVRLFADQTLTSFIAADPTNPRIDVVAVKRARSLTEEETRQFWDESTNQTYEQSTNTRDLDACEFVVVQGTPAASPVAPTEYEGEPLTDNWLVLAEITIPASATTITGSNIEDARVLYSRPKMADSSIDTDQLTSGAVTGAKLASSAVSTSKLAANAVNNSKVAAYSIENDRLEGVRRGVFDLNSSWLDCWSSDTKDWEDRLVFVHCLTNSQETRKAIDLDDTNVSYTVGQLGLSTITVSVDATSKRLKFSASDFLLNDCFIRVEDCGANT